MGRSAPDDETMAAILRSLPMIEYEENTKRYRLRFTDLKFHIDRCERVLRDCGAPMHFKEIYLEIHRLAPTTLGAVRPQQLARSMFTARQFVSVGRCGFWGLKEWPGVQTGTIADIAAERQQIGHTHKSKQTL